MSLNHGWWDGPHSYHDQRQNAAIEQLRVSLRAQSSSVRRQAERNRQATDRLAASLVRLEERLDDVIELTDLRFQLLDHHETNRVRNELNRRLSVLSRGGTVPVDPLDDIPGYWLPPAANLILATFCGNGGLDLDRELELGRERDRVRTDLFVLASGVGFEVRELSQRVVVGLLNQPVHPDVVDNTLQLDTAINRTWRQLWVDTAAGGFGDRAHDVLRQRLAAAVDDLEIANELGRVLGSRNTNALTGLKRLRERCQRVTAAMNRSETGAPDTDAWRETLRSLVNEGHAEEIELRDRTERLLRRVSDAGDAASVGMWTEVGTLRSLLVHDILEPSVPDAQAALALRVCADAVMLCAQRQWDRTHADVPDQRVVRIEGVDVTVTARGPEPGADEEVARRIAARHQVDGKASRLWGAAVGGLVLVALIAFLVSVPVLGGLALLGAVCCTPGLVGAIREPKKAEELQMMQLSLARKRIERTQQELGRLDVSVAGTSREAATERDEIHRLLGPYGRND